MAPVGVSDSRGLYQYTSPRIRVPQTLEPYTSPFILQLMDESFRLQNISPGYKSDEKAIYCSLVEILFY